jgi:hypothetical protein
MKEWIMSMDKTQRVRHLLGAAVLALFAGGASAAEAEARGGERLSVEQKVCNERAMGAPDNADRSAIFNKCMENCNSFKQRVEPPSIYHGKLQLYTPPVTEP